MIIPAAAERYERMTRGRDDSAATTVCPHWSPVSKNCLLCKSGLFLPVAEHVITYCQAENYTSCPQFIEAMGHDEGLAITDNRAETDRRRHARIPVRIPFRISEFSATDTYTDLHKDPVCTVDISRGGLCFESTSSLSVDSHVKFSISHHFSDDSFAGTGRVRWCRPLENSPFFHIGISFASFSLARNICSRLGLTID